eukprot:TRINITY_DN3791_c0_g2_i1.p1 TRINITY_DN3791_c0_g2~~TRINITY_DN3791_c0_g2_i1.p1  ORF type:complete len:507 (-),score=37.02 TRINITY_DN3791_c0_g2_i1:2245-3696(-)
MIFVFKQSKIVPACFQALQLRNLQYYSPLIQLYQSEQQPTTREESRYVRDDGYKFQFREIQSFESLYKVLQQSGSRLSGEDRAAALTRIRQIADQQGIQPPHVLLDKIQQLLVERLDGDGVSPKALASIFHGLTKLELHHDSKLFEQVLQLVQERHVLEQLDSVRLLNVLQVAKQINTANTLFLSNIAAELCYKHVNHIDSQGIAQVFIAFGKLRKEFSMVLNALGNQLILRNLGPELQSFNIGQIILACGQLQRNDQELISYLVDEIKRRGYNQFNPIVIGNIISGLAMLRQYNKDLLSSLTEQLASNWSFRSIHPISWIAFSLLCFDFKHEGLLQHFAKTFDAELELVRKPSTLSRLAYALAYWDQLSIDNYFRLLHHLIDLQEREFEFTEFDWYALHQIHLLLGLNVKLDIPIPDRLAPFIEQVEKVKENRLKIDEADEALSNMYLKVSVGLHELGIQHEQKKGYQLKIFSFLVIQDILR